VNGVVVLEVFVGDLVSHPAKSLVELNYLHAHEALFFKLVNLSHHGQVKKRYDLGGAKLGTVHVTFLHEGAELIKRH
jgi:hypothetical protein